MAESDLFEEMLATYPAEKRELARKVYQRFADGDSAQFFSQLFLVLDVYAHYAERIPNRMIAAKLLPAVEAATIKPKTAPPIGEPLTAKRGAKVNLTN